MRKLSMFKAKDIKYMRKDHNFPKLIGLLSDRMATGEQPLAAFGDAQVVGAIVHALAKLKQPDNAIMNKVNEEAVWFVKEGDSRAIANTAWAFATLNMTAPELFQEIEKQPLCVVAS